MQKIQTLPMVGAMTLAITLLAGGGNTAFAHDTHSHGNSKHYSSYDDDHRHKHKKHYRKKTTFHHRHRNNGVVVYDSYHGSYGNKVVYYTYDAPRVYYPKPTYRRNYGGSSINLSFHID